MNNRTERMEGNEAGLTRRGFLVRCSALAASGATVFFSLTVNSSAAQPPNIMQGYGYLPVVSFYAGRPYLDKTGRATPYFPPNGTRSGQFLAEPSAEEILCRYGYF